MKQELNNMKQEYTEYLKNAIIDAIDWEQFATLEEYSTIRHSDLKTKCIERCLSKHRFIINNLVNEIDELEYDNSILLSGDSYDIVTLERKINTLEKKLESIGLPNKTLIDIEKIEFIKENWDKLTYDNLKSILNQTK